MGGKPELYDLGRSFLEVVKKHSRERAIHSITAVILQLGL